MLASPGEVAFNVLGFPIYYYGLIMACALSLGVLIAKFCTEKFYPEINSEIIYDISPYVIFGAIIGARLYYCILSWEFYFNNPIEIFLIRHGGISIHGAILGGLIAGIIYAKKHNLAIFKLCDVFSCGLILGQAIGRWGNFFNSEAFGKPTEVFYKLYIPIYKRPIEYLQNDFFHPTFLYECIADVCIFFILFALATKITKKYNGIIFFVYLILYSIVRIFIEQIRIDSVLNIYGIPMAQIVSALTICASSIMIFVIIKGKNGQKEI